MERIINLSSRKLALTWPFKRYKSYDRNLKATATEWFQNKGFVTNKKMRYCLDLHESWPQNIICSDVAEYIKKESEQRLGKKLFPLHKYLHHGLSSQAMLFNLIGPLIIRKELSALHHAVNSIGMIWPEGEVNIEFEYYDRKVFNEDSGQPTSIDLAILGKTKNTFIEAKLVEREFGVCSIFSDGDCDGRNPITFGFENCYLQHIGRKYWELMDEFGFFGNRFCQWIYMPIC